MESDFPPDTVGDPHRGSAEPSEEASRSGEASAPPDPPAAEARARCLWRRGGAAAMTWGAASIVGRRKEMEDAVAVAPAFMDVTCERVGGCAAPQGSGEISQLRFFGVYDGHGGAQVR